MTKKKSTRATLPMSIIRLFYDQKEKLRRDALTNAKSIRMTEEEWKSLRKNGNPFQMDIRMAFAPHVFRREIGRVGNARYAELRELS